MITDQTRAIKSANASRQGRNRFWNEARDDLIRANASAFSQAEIAALIGDGCTPGMVAGRAARIGVSIKGKRGLPKNAAAVPSDSCCTGNTNQEPARGTLRNFIANLSRRLGFT